MAESFQTEVYQLGIAGLNLKAAADLVPPTQLLKMTNVIGTKLFAGEIQSRLGQTSTATAGTNQHSLTVIRSFTNNTVIVLGADGDLYYGVAGPLNLVASGFSGLPLSFVAYRPAGSSIAWVFIGDVGKMCKISSEGLVLPIGLPAVSAGVAGVLSTQQETEAEPFSSTAGWGVFAYNGSGVPAGPALDPNPVTGNGLAFTTNPGAAAGAYANAWDHGIAVDFTLVGTLPASDSDYISFYLKMDAPDLISDIRLDFGVGGSGDNFYTKHFRPSDATQVSVSGQQPSIVGEDQVARYQQTDQALDIIDDDRSELQVIKAQRQAANVKSLQAATGADSWTLFGTYGVVLRRGDFLRRGNDQTVGWDDIQSITVTVFVSTTDSVTVSLSDLKLLGGSGPDTGEFGLSAYDYRVINYDTRTGAKSNPSPEGAAVNSLRTSIVISPVAYGNDAIRQWIYRRGGTLNADWYFVGQNTTDGGVFTDTASDAEAGQGGTLEIDNYQPVATVNASGTTVLSQPCFSLFGPAQDFLFAVGDPYRAGTVYYCKQGQPDSWPPDNATEVCSPGEPLQAGGVFGTQAFVFSISRMFYLLPNAGVLGKVTAIPTACQHGLVSRTGLCVGVGGIYLVASDGIYVTSGQGEEILSEMIESLFDNEIRNGYYPVDFNYAEKIKLAIYDNDLWFTYQDLQGKLQIMVYSLQDKYWRHYNFTYPIASLIADTEANQRLLLGGNSSGITYEHSGVSDNGEAIFCTLQSPYLDQQNKRQMKSYGDAILDLSRGGAAVTVQPFFDTGLTTAQPVVITQDSQADL